jgi:hypothetical protein
MGEEKSANSANSYGVDMNWYADSGATDYVTGELHKLTMKDNYNGSDQIYTANRSGMYIKHIGQSIIRTPLCDLKLNNVLHVPQASKTLDLFIILPLTTMFSFNFTLMFSLSRIGSRGKLFCTTKLEEVSILFHAT